MDSSLSKALIMIASVLLAIIVIGFMTFTFRRTGDWATTQDDEMLTKQAAEFNQQFEAYDKDLMYGVDVISCLNKAKSNNDQIIDARKINGDKYDDSYQVIVAVQLESSELNESMTVYYIENMKVRAYDEGEGPSGVYLKDVGFDFMKKKGRYYKEISQFKEDNLLCSSPNNKIDLKTKKLELTKDGNGNGEERLRTLLEVSNTISEIKSNLNKEESGNVNSWTKVEFRSALYDLKTRKFKCTNIEYSAQTGRINKIEFEEM